MEKTNILRKVLKEKEWMYTTPFLKYIQNSTSNIDSLDPYMEMQISYRTPIVTTKEILSDISTEDDTDISPNYAPRHAFKHGLQARRSDRARTQPVQYTSTQKKILNFGRLDISLLYFDTLRAKF